MVEYKGLCVSEPGACWAARDLRAGWGARGGLSPARPWPACGTPALLGPGKATGCEG